MHDLCFRGGASQWASYFPGEGKKILASVLFAFEIIDGGKEGEKRLVLFVSLWLIRTWKQERREKKKKKFCITTVVDCFQSVEFKLWHQHLSVPLRWFDFCCFFINWLKNPLTWNEGWLVFRFQRRSVRSLFRGTFETILVITRDRLNKISSLCFSSVSYY